MNSRHMCDPSLDAQHSGEARNGYLNGRCVDRKNGLNRVNEGDEDGICGSVIESASADIEGSSKDVDGKTAVTFKEGCSNAGLDGTSCSVCVGGDTGCTEEAGGREFGFAG